MSRRVIEKQTRRVFRSQARTNAAVAAFLTRGFFGRWKWLLFGR